MSRDRHPKRDWTKKRQPVEPEYAYILRMLRGEARRFRKSDMGNLKRSQILDFLAMARYEVSWARLLELVETNSITDVEISKSERIPAYDKRGKAGRLCKLYDFEMSQHKTTQQKVTQLIAPK